MREKFEKDLRRVGARVDEARGAEGGGGGEGVVDALEAPPLAGLKKGEVDDPEEAKRIQRCDINFDTLPPSRGLTNS
jgi:hypothetical protein